MIFGLSDHPDRADLAGEVHARPYLHLEAPVRATHLAVISGETTAEEDRAHVAALCVRYGAAPPRASSNFHYADLGDFTLRWERHTEFTSFTFLAHEPAKARFEDPVLNRVPKDWLERIQGQIMVALHLEMEQRQGNELDPEDLPVLFETDNFAGAMVSGGSAIVFMNFLMGSDGFGRILVRDKGLRPRQAGRLVQRLIEIETYRMMALLALPLARKYSRALTEADERLSAITADMNQADNVGREQDLLVSLTELSVEVEAISAATTYRFGASRAYSELVARRIEELREERIEGYQTLLEFMGRRFTPAMRTCEATAARLEHLSQHLTRANQLLRTRVEVALEAQNQELLQSMDRRAKLQLRLQETVEGLSVAAISYYVVSLVGYAAKALKPFGLPGESYIYQGVAIPIVVGLIWLGVRRMKKAIMKDQEAGEL